MTIHRTTFALIATVAALATSTGTALACGGPDMTGTSTSHAKQAHTSHAKHRAHTKHHAARR